MGFSSPSALTTMLSARSGDALVVWAPAKVNLFLEVLARRPDGYHEIATLMVTVSLYDTLEFKEDTSGLIRLHCDQPDLSTGPDNLVVHAAELLRQRSGCTRGAHIGLVKRIPLAAGLAGGSTDAAAALVGLNQLWGLGLADVELAALAAELGSDVPFFFAAPAAWCTGRGEKVAPLALGRPLWLLLVCPGFGLATAEVYRGVKVPPNPLTGAEIRAAVAAGDVEEVGRRLHNRLQEPAERLNAEVAEVRAGLEELAPAGALMSGSGSSVFALCRDHDEAVRLAHKLSPGPEQENAAGPPPRVGWKMFLVRSCV
jgi:4-diphosphocytidyl-2-C-methyl-D-erythritol kinase